jgi:hypothetical protein
MLLEGVLHLLHLVTDEEFTDPRNSHDVAVKMKKRPLRMLEDRNRKLWSKVAPACREIAHQLGAHAQEDDGVMLKLDAVNLM